MANIRLYFYNRENQPIYQNDTHYYFEFSRNPDRIEFTHEPEWRIRHSGTSFYPRARYRRRQTLRVTLSGLLPWSDINSLDTLIEPNEETRVVVKNCDVIDENEIWAMTKLSYTVTEKFDLNGNRMLEYQLVLERIGRLS